MNDSMESTAPSGPPILTFPHKGGRNPFHGRLSTMSELVRLCARNGRYWLIPLVGVLGLTAVLLIVVSVIEYVAPFVYSIF